MDPQLAGGRAHRPGRNPQARLLAIFDGFHEWFLADGFEGCSFINVLLESPQDRSCARRQQGIWP